MDCRGASTLLVILLAGCAGPIPFDLPGVMDRLIPGRSLAQTVKADGLEAPGLGVTVGRLTGSMEDASPLQAEPGDFWPDPVATPPTLGPLANTLHREGALPAAPAGPAVVQPTPRDVAPIQPTQTP